MASSVKMVTRDLRSTKLDPVARHLKKCTRYLYTNELERHCASRPRLQCTTRRLSDSVVYLQQRRLESYIYLQNHALTMCLCSVYANPSTSSLCTPASSCVSVPFKVPTVNYLRRLQLRTIVEGLMKISTSKCICAFYT